MSSKIFRVEKVVPLPDLPDANEILSDLRDADQSDPLFSLAKELTGELIISGRGIFSTNILFCTVILKVHKKFLKKLNHVLKNHAQNT
jgi:hypothetical protein